MFKAISENKTTYLILSSVLLLGLTLFLTGYFWQAKSTRLQTVYYFLVVAPILLSFTYQIRNYSFNPLFFLSFTLILYTMTTVFWSEDVSIQSLFHQFKKGLLLLSLFLAVNHVRKRYPDFEANILNLMTFFAIFLAIYNIYTLMITTGLSGRIHGWGLLDNANVTAEVFGIIFLYTFMQFLKTENKTKMFVFLFISALILVEIFLNKSRGQQGALIIAIIISLYFVPGKNLKRLIPIAAVALASLILLIYSSNIIETIINRNAGFSCRDTIWADLLPSAMNTFFFGRGVGSSSGYITYCYELSNEPLSGTHSIYMYVLLYTGITGVGLGLLTTFYAVKTAFKSHNEFDKFWGIIIIYGFIAFIPNGDSLVSRPNEVWPLFWVPLAFISSRKG